MGRGKAGYLMIGFHTSLSAENLRARLVEFGCRYPQGAISTVEGSRLQLFDGIHNGTIDIAVVTGEPASDTDPSEEPAQNRIRLFMGRTARRTRHWQCDSRRNPVLARRTWCRASSARSAARKHAAGHRGVFLVDKGETAREAAKRQAAVP